MERPDVVDQRVRYLKAVKQARYDGHPIVYMDETYVSSSHEQMLANG